MVEATVDSPPTPPAALPELIGRMVGEIGAAISIPLTLLGLQLGLWRALHDAGPLTPAEVADRSGCATRYIEEWLAAQAAAGLLHYEPTAGTFELPAHVASVMADEDGPFFLGGFFEAVAALHTDLPLAATAFRTGDGVEWADRHGGFHRALAKATRTGLRRDLIANWMPELGDAEARMRAGAAVADVGCGEGNALVLLAGAFPASTFIGFDTHQPSLEHARANVAAAGIGDRVRLEGASATDYGPGPYDIVWFFDSLHDLGDPLGAATHTRQVLADDGIVIVVEPVAGDALEDNLNPVGRIFYGLSTLVCTPTSMAQPGQAALGAQAGPARLAAIADAAGFTRFRLAAKSLTQAVYEIRP